MLLFSSCCTDILKEKSNAPNNGNVLKSPTTIAINKSVITARIEDIVRNENGNFMIKAFLVKVEEDPSYPNLAMAGRTYNLIPNFQLDGDKKIMSDSEKNKGLFTLSKLKSGDEFRAIIFFENLTGWFIQEVLTN